MSQTPSYPQKIDRVAKALNLVFETRDEIREILADKKVTFWEALRLQDNLRNFAEVIKHREELLDELRDLQPEDLQDYVLWSTEAEKRNDQIQKASNFLTALDQLFQSES